MGVTSATMIPRTRLGIKEQGFDKVTGLIDWTRLQTETFRTAYNLGQDREGLVLECVTVQSAAR